MYTSSPWYPVSSTQKEKVEYLRQRHDFGQVAMLPNWKATPSGQTAKLFNWVTK